MGGCCIDVYVSEVFRCRQMSEHAIESPLRREQRENARVTLKKLLLIVPVMLVFCASMVPLYRQICEVLGITATKAVAQNTQVDTGRTVMVEFDSNVNQHFGWRFEAVEKAIGDSSGRGGDDKLSRDQHTSACNHRASRPQFWSIGGGTVFQQDCLLLFQQPDVAGG